MYFPKPSMNENDLAIIERSNTAAHSIEAGQYVSWHGKTGKAKADILQGATLDDTLFDYDEDGILNAFFKIDTLFTGDAQSGNIQLSNSVENYDFIIVEGQAVTYTKNTSIIPVQDITYYSSAPSEKWIVSMFQSSSVYANLEFYFNSATGITITGNVHAAWDYGKIVKIYGVRLGH